MTAYNIGAAFVVALCVLWAIGLGFTAHRIWLDNRDAIFQFVRDSFGAVFHDDAGAA